MAYQILFFFCILSIAHSNPTNPPSPKVYEDVKEEPEETIRVARHPKFHQSLHEPPKFDYKQMVQQDPQKIRYAQQQQMDSYIRAYQHEHHLRRGSKSKSRKQQPSAVVKTAYDTRPKSENVIQTPRQFNSFPVVVETEHNTKKKVVDPKTVPIANNGKFPNSEHQKSTGYKVKEDDLETQPSIRDAKVYLDQEDLLKSTLSANYLAKHPTYILANPQLNIDPKLLMQGLQYTLPENHQLSAAGFQAASKTDIEALSSLLGKTPNVQLQGLTELLAQQSAHPAAVPHSQEIPNGQLQGLSELLAQQSVYPAAVPHSPEIPQTPREVSVQPEALLGLQDHTPIKEEIPAPLHHNPAPLHHNPAPLHHNPASLHHIPASLHHIPETHVDINSHSHTQIKHEVKIIPETKSIYEGHQDGNLQYAAQYAFGYKIRDYHSGSNFGHEEVREGDVAKGHYHVLLPDGRLQNVDYWADPSGYHAKVTYSNVAQH